MKVGKFLSTTLLVKFLLHTQPDVLNYEIGTNITLFLEYSTEKLFQEKICKVCKPYWSYFYMMIVM